MKLFNAFRFTLLGLLAITQIGFWAVACTSSSASAPTRNVAEDTVLYVEPKAKCERVVTSDAYDSVRCEVPSGAKMYCTASSAGFVCQALNQVEAKK